MATEAKNLVTEDRQERHTEIDAAIKRLEELARKISGEIVPEGEKQPEPTNPSLSEILADAPSRLEGIDARINKAVDRIENLIF